MRDEKEEEAEASGVKAKKGKNGPPLTNYFSKSGKTSEKEKDPKVPIVPLPKKEKKKKNWEEEDDEWNFQNKENTDEEDDLDIEEDLNSDDELLRRFQEMKAGSNQKPSVANPVQESKKTNENKKMQIEKIPEIKKFSPVKSKAKGSADEKSSRASGMEIETIRGTRPPSSSKEEPSKKIVPEKGSSKNAKKVKGKQVSEDEGDDENIIQGVLSGMAFVITGELVSVSDKKEMQEMIKVLGGRAMGDVSRKTTHLIVGHKLMDGREPNQSNKYQKAEKLKLPMLSEEQFGELLLKKTNMSLVELLEGGAVTFAKGGQATAMNKKMDEEKPQPKNEGKVAEPKKGMDVEKKVKNELWTDKYAPTSTIGIIGNEGMVNKLREWLEDW